MGPWYKRLRENKSVLLFLISMASMLDIINVASITIALPSILRDVGYDSNNLQWCVSAYALTYAAFLLIGGRMGDLFGHKRIFLLGTSWFSVWALICGFARNPIFMSVARALEGAGAGFTIPSALALLTTSYPPGAERTFALSIFSGAAITGQTIGVLLGGVFDATIGWQWIFFLTAIFSAALSVAGFFIITEHKEKPSRQIDSRIDYGGAFCFMVGIIAIIYYLTESTTAGWGSAKTLAPFLVGVALLISFVVLEYKIDYPMMPFHIWKSRRFLSSIIVIICLTATYNTMIFYSSLTFQNVLHYNSLITACCYIVHGVGLIIGLYTVTKLFSFTRTKVIMAFGWCFVIGSAIIFAQIKPDSTYWQYAFPAFIINCVGLSPTWMCCQVNAVADAKDEDQGIVGAFFNVGIQLGAPIGLAIANIIAEAHTPAGAVDGQLMDGYRPAFYAYAVMGGVGLIMMLIFAANRDPPEFAEVASDTAKGLEEVIHHNHEYSNDLERNGAGGDMKEVEGTSGEKAEIEERIGYGAGQSVDSTASSSSVSLDIPAEKGSEKK
ncbi:major facilitator superfamily domain-containing protein [Gamsiella multidivaricata]|uniref:major facilitator superfamily domain-containing protein n=1 Tax=Gamsiella multidivaricata TaxID=101098 RepID=UPI00221E8D11|nr:major facilitator superfamily domain-containing protein [Gamsiella multidivaricata]KAI7827512.1 major facilitator superfamily domain-containing protein [Gamsiella multidivaricata]